MFTNTKDVIIVIVLLAVTNKHYSFFVLQFIKCINSFVCSVKIHDLAEMKEIYAIINVDDAAG